MKPRPSELQVRHYGQNSGGDYYKVNGNVNVIHLAGVSQQFICLDCRLNRCEHTEAVALFIEAGEPVECVA